MNDRTRALERWIRNGHIPPYFLLHSDDLEPMHVVKFRLALENQYRKSMNSLRRNYDARGLIPIPKTRKMYRLCWSVY
jgi:hypothetical protein